MNISLKKETKHAQERKYCDTAGGAHMKHDIPFLANKIAVVECHSWTYSHSAWLIFAHLKPTSKIFTIKQLSVHSSSHYVATYTYKDQHNYEKTQQKKPNFNAWQSALHCGKNLLVLSCNALKVNSRFSPHALTRLSIGQEILPNTSSNCRKERDPTWSQL